VRCSHPLTVLGCARVGDAGSCCAHATHTRVEELHSLVPWAASDAESVRTPVPVRAQGLCLSVVRCSCSAVGFVPQSGVVMAHSGRDENGESSASELTSHDLAMVMQALIGRPVAAEDTAMIEPKQSRGAAGTSGDSATPKVRGRRTRR